MIIITDLCKSYGNKTILNNFNCTLPDKGFIAISGESGIGKTTLIRILAGLESADSGNISFKSDASFKPVFSMVFQEDRLLERKSALENVMIVMKGADRDLNIKKASKILSLLGLEDDIHTRVSDLSGGMRRRIAIARALAAEADIYLMDEPIKGLDPANRDLTLKTIFKYTKNKLLIIVSHNQEEISGADMEIKL